ncbi:MAG TPA: hypothetical protein VGL93_07470 [Streptosporangiaceae bacterium]|jgi:hypothetical protein
MDPVRAKAALRLIARGFAELAEAVGDEPDDGELPRTAALIREWGRRGLTKQEASALFQRHGFAPQTTGGWTRGGWAEVGADGLRHLTDKSHDWLAAYDTDDTDEAEEER